MYASFASPLLSFPLPFTLTFSARLVVYTVSSTIQCHERGGSVLATLRARALAAITIAALPLEGLAIAAGERRLGGRLARLRFRRCLVALGGGRR